MRFSHDRRGQSVVIGTVILFGFLIVAMALYQAQVVPMENANIEFEHSQTVENDFTDLRNSILRASTAGSAQPARVQLGTRYPQRTFFVNPGPASGNLETTSPESIRIENAEIGDGAHPNVQAFWDDSPEFDDGVPVFDTRSLQYRANYNEYREAPQLTYEHSVVAAEFDNDVLLRSDQTIVRDGRIGVTALTGQISENGIESRSVDPEAVSTGVRTVPVTGDGEDDIELVLPTAVDDEGALEARWEQRLPSDADVSVADGNVRITLPDRSDSYRLRLSEVSVEGEGTTDEAYIVPVGSETVTVGSSIGVEVRDKYNNPVEGAKVDIGSDQFTTDDDGRVFTEAGSAGTLTATINDGNEDYEEVEFDVNPVGEGDGESRTFNVEWAEDGPIEVVKGEDRNLVVEVTDPDDEPIRDASIDYSIAPIGDVSGFPTIAVIRENTEGEGEISIEENEEEIGDEFNLYASAGDDVDQIEVEIVDPDGPSDPSNGELPGTLTAEVTQEGGGNTDWIVTMTYDGSEQITAVADPRQRASQSGTIGPGGGSITLNLGTGGGGQTYPITVSGSNDDGQSCEAELTEGDGQIEVC